jgi:hypothetical protein
MAYILHPPGPTQGLPPLQPEYVAEAKADQYIKAHLKEAGLRCQIEWMKICKDI